MAFCHRGTTNYVAYVYISIAHYFDVLHLIEDKDGEHILVISENFLLATYNSWA
jgi:hypothetical protein